MAQGEIDDLGTEYDFAYIKANPIRSVCKKCRRREPINAPSLANVRCFWCGSEVSPVDKAEYRERLANLWKHSIARQLPLLEFQQAVE